MQLDSLYPELLLQVSEHLSRREWKHLRLTCKTLANTFAALVVNKVVIDGGEDGVLDMLDILSGHAPMTPPLYAIKTLWIHALSKSVLPSRDGNSDNQAQDPGQTERDTIYLSVLLSALSQLNHVQSIRWQIHSYENKAFIPPVGEVVTAYQTLEDLHLITIDAPPLPILGRFRNLSSINYASLDVLSLTSPANHIGNSLVQSPHLRSFSVWCESYSELVTLLAPCASEGIVLPLTSLQLRRCPSPLPFLPHVQHLKVLDIAGSRYYASHATDRHPELARFWIELTERQVTLTHISIDHAPDSLLGYLKSYCGLVSFSLCSSRKPTSHINQRMEMASLFYHDVIVNHRLTLKKLVLRCDYREEWCWNPEIQAALRQLISLKHICLGISYALLESSLPRDIAENENGSPSDMMSSLHLMLHFIVTECPSIDILEVHSTLTSLAQDGNSYGVMWDMLERVVCGYRPGVAVKKLPVIYGGPEGQSLTTYFAPVHDKNRSRLVYMTCKKT